MHTIFIHINKILCVSFSVFSNNDYYSGVIWSVMRDIDFSAGGGKCCNNFSQSRREEVYNLLQQQTEGLNMTILRFAYATPPFTRPRITLQSTLPAGVDLTHYQSGRIILLSIRYCVLKTFSVAICRDDRLFRDTPELWDGARDHGLNKGYPVSDLAKNHAQGFVRFRRSRSAGRFMKTSREMRIRTPTELSLLTLLRLEDAMVMPPEMKFSRRELENIEMDCGGKTSAEVAIILLSQKNTVNFHQKKYATKIQCAK